MTVRLSQLNWRTANQSGGKNAQARAIDHRGVFGFHADGSSAAIVPYTMATSSPMAGSGAIRRGIGARPGGLLTPACAGSGAIPSATGYGCAEKHASSMRRKKRPAATSVGAFLLTLMTSRRPSQRSPQLAAEVRDDRCKVRRDLAFRAELGVLQRRAARLLSGRDRSARHHAFCLGGAACRPYWRSQFKVEEQHLHP